MVDEYLSGILPVPNVILSKHFMSLASLCPQGVSVRSGLLSINNIPQLTLEKKNSLGDMW